MAEIPTIGDLASRAGIPSTRGLPDRVMRRAIGLNDLLHLLLQRQLAEMVEAGCGRGARHQ